MIWAQNLQQHTSTNEYLVINTAQILKKKYLVVAIVLRREIIYNAELHAGNTNDIINSQAVTSLV